MLIGVIVDGVRIKTGIALAQESARVALYSALSDYHAPLKEAYGIFVLAVSEEELRTQISKSLEDNLIFRAGNSPEGALGAWDIYGFQIDQHLLTRYAPLSDPQVLKQAILEYMKYRAPKSLITESLELFTKLEESIETAAHLKDKLALERKLDQVAYSEKNLKNAIAWFHSFSVSELVQRADAMINLGQEIAFLEQERDEIREELRSLRGDDEEEKDQREYLNEILRDLNQTLSDVRGELTETGREIESSLDQAISMAVVIGQEAQQMLELTSQLSQEIENYRESLQSSKVNTATLEEEIRVYEGLLNFKGLEGLIERSKEERSILEGAQNRFSSFEREVRSIDYDSSGQTRGLAEAREAFESQLRQLRLDWDYQGEPPPGSSPPPDTDGLEDNRRESTQKAKELLKEPSGKEDIVIPEELAEKLPSKGEASSDALPEAALDEKEEGADYSQAGLEKFSAMAERFAAKGISLRDQLYLNEYILEVFHHYRTTGAEGRTAYFNYEAEYILHGNRSQEENFSKTKTELMMIRFIMNLIYAYQTPRYEKAADAIGALLAIPFGGAAQPLFKTLVLGGWALNFSSEDLQNILAGEKVSFYRDQENPKLDYEDYLRILLLNPFLSESTKLARIQDILYLNLNKKLGDQEAASLGNYYSGLQLQLDYSVKTLFFQQGDTNRNFTGIQPRRFRLKLVQLQGY